MNDAEHDSGHDINETGDRFYHIFLSFFYFYSIATNRRIL